MILQGGNRGMDTMVRRDESKQPMQSLYKDEYGILGLISTQTVDQQSRSQSRFLEDFSEAISWFVRIKGWCLLKMNTPKLKRTNTDAEMLFLKEKSG